VYGNADQVCIAVCQDLIFESDGPPIDQILQFCQANARVSTNFDTTQCYPNVCTDAGEFNNFNDPRRTPEDVIWVNTIGTEALNYALTRIAPTTGETVADYNAGAASLQLMKERDGWVEFAVGQTGKDHVVGFSTTNCEPPCDEDPSLENVQVGMSLNMDGRVYLIVDGVLMKTGPDFNGSYGTYDTFERFRVAFKDNFDDTATISLARVNGPCPPGTECNVTPLVTHGTPLAYPLRVDTSFREYGASLVHVNIVRVKERSGED
jgi:hypothetical protein